MTDVTPLEIPASQTGTAQVVTPVYRYLMHQPEHWMCQAFFVGRLKLPVSRVAEAMQANERNLEEAARDWSLPVAAVEEALDDYQRFHDLIAADADDELALSEELAQRPSPPP